MKQIKSCAIVDDDMIFKKLLSRIITNTSFCETILNFDNGQQALHFVNEIQDGKVEMPDVIFLDLNMPILDGWQFLEDFENRSFSKKPALFVLSSSIEENDVEQVKMYSCVSGMLVKPLEYEDLEKVKKMMSA